MGAVYVVALDSMVVTNISADYDVCERSQSRVALA